MNVSGSVAIDPSRTSCWDWTATNADQLLRQLARMDFSMPPRGMGRLASHVEHRMLGRLLATLARTPFLDYPISVTKTERPDFVITAGSRKIGLEVTEATTLGHVHALANQQFPDGALIDESLFRFGGEPLTRSEIEAHLHSRRLTGPGWVGDEVERDWAAGVLAAVTTKARKLNEATYSRPGQNWLSIYDRIPGGLLDLDRGLEILRPQLAALSDSHRFDFIAVDTSSVEGGPRLVLVSGAGGFSLPIHRL